MKIKIQMRGLFPKHLLLNVIQKCSLKNTTFLIIVMINID